MCNGFAVTESEMHEPLNVRARRKVAHITTAVLQHDVAHHIYAYVYDFSYHTAMLISHNTLGIESTKQKKAF